MERCAGSAEEEEVGEGADVGGIDGAVGVDVGRGGVTGREAEEDADEGTEVSYGERAGEVEVARHGRAEVGQPEVVEADPVLTVLLVEPQADGECAAGDDGAEGDVLVVAVAEGDGGTWLAVGIAVGGAVDVDAEVGIVGRQVG